MEKSKLAKMKFTLEDIKDINPVPLNCHHGRRVGSVCVCDEGWKTKTNNVPKKELRFIYDWCNVKIKKAKYSHQRALLLTGLGVIGFTLLIGWIIIIWTCFVAGSGSLGNDRESSGNIGDLLKAFKVLWDSLRFRLTVWWQRKDHGFVHTSYEPKNDNELQLRKGQVVKDIVRFDAEGWYEGTCDGVRGYFHQDYVTVKAEESNEQSETE